MARSQRGSASAPKSLAIELLESDHRKVEMMFDEYEQEKDAGEDAKQALAQRICTELTIHAQIEEELFYPWLRENLDAEDMEMLEEAYVEHSSAKDLIAQIEAGGGIDEAFDAKVKVLGEYVKHHVKEEENEIIPKVSRMREELDELGQEMHARKAELMEEHGLMMDDETSGLAMAAGGRQSRSRSQGAQQRGSR